MRCISLLAGLGLAAMLACSGDSTSVSQQHSYAVQVKAGTTVGVGQDSTFNLATTLVVLRDSKDTIAGPRFEFSSSDLTKAIVSPSGVITGVGGGSVTINATFQGNTLAIPVTVRARPATSVDLGGHPDDNAIYYARPGHAPSSVLRMLVKAGTDTVFCNPVVCSNFATRTQRIVRVYSLDTLRAQISDVAGTTRGQITAKDTGTVKFVLSVPGDGKADTMSITFKLRPIDSLILRVDTITDAASTRAYTGTNVPKGGVLALGTGYLFKTPAIPAVGNGVAIAANTNAVNLNTLATVNAAPNGRSRYPTITWTSVPGILIVSANGLASANRNVGTAPTCSSANVIVAAEGSNGTGIDPYLNTVPTTFQPPAATVQTGCVAPLPTTLARPRAATCTRTSTAATDPGAFCVVYVQAKMTDEVSGLTKITYIAITTRAP